MTSHNIFQKQLTIALRKTGSNKCIEKAELLEHEPSSMHSLNLRDLELNPSNIASIADILKQEGDHQSNTLNSISFSYNPHLGDAGVIRLVKSLPESIFQLGLVDCGIGDAGGVEILNWMNDAPKLQMICMEQNDFSDGVKVEFEEFRAANPHVLVVY